MLAVAVIWLSAINAIASMSIALAMTRCRSKRSDSSPKQNLPTTEQPKKRLKTDGREDLASPTFSQRMDWCWPRDDNEPQLPVAKTIAAKRRVKRTGMTRCSGCDEGLGW